MTTTDSSGILDFTPPPPAHMRRAFALARAWFKPQFLGLSELELKKPALFVGNHTLFGLTDVPLMTEHIYSRYGVLLRGLGDRAHFDVPGWGKLLAKYGLVLGSPENCSALMESGASILVFPGGAREVMHRKGEAYKLIWKKRTGFARLAIQHGYDIIPFGSVGPDESYRILWDANDMMRTRAWKWLAERTSIESLTRNGDMLPPIPLGLGPTFIPRPQRFYFGFGARIPTVHLRGSEGDPAAVWALREQVAEAIDTQITRLQLYRTEDWEQNWSRVRRWLAPLQT